MSAIVTATTGTLDDATHGGSETQLEAGIDTAGVFLYRISLQNLAGGTTPDIVEIREYMELFNGNGEQLVEGSPYTYQGGLSPALIELPHRSIPASVGYRVTVHQVQGTNRDFPWVRLELG